MIHPVEPEVLVRIDLFQATSRHPALHRTPLEVPRASRLGIAHHGVAPTLGKDQGRILPLHQTLQRRESKRHPVQPQAEQTFPQHDLESVSPRESPPPDKPCPAPRPRLPTSAHAAAHQTSPCPPPCVSLLHAAPSPSDHTRQHTAHRAATPCLAAALSSKDRGSTHRSEPVPDASLSANQRWPPPCSAAKYCWSAHRAATHRRC